MRIKLSFKKTLSNTSLLINRSIKILFLFTSFQLISTNGSANEISCSHDIIGETSIISELLPCTDEFDASLALYNSTNGPNWSDNLNWEVGDPCINDWYSVEYVGSNAGKVFLKNKNILSVNSHCEILAANTSNSPLPLPCTSDSMALVELYNATNGPMWTNNTNWLVPGQPIDTWYHVYVNGAGEVQNLYLNNNNLDGTIPPDIGCFSNIKQLRLNDNSLTNGIPPEIGNLTTLIQLQLQNNTNLGGSIPSEIGNLTSMGLMFMENCNLTGSIPPELGNLTIMTQLKLHNNSLSGPIPNELSNITSLTFLLLSNNQLSGLLPPDLGDISPLNYFWINDNILEGCYPEGYSAFCGMGSNNLRLYNNSDLPGAGSFNTFDKVFCDQGEDPDLLMPNFEICSSDGMDYDLTIEEPPLWDIGFTLLQVIIDVEWYNGEPGNGGTIFPDPEHADISMVPTDGLWVNLVDVSDDDYCEYKFRVYFVNNPSPTIIDPMIEVCNADANPYDLTLLNGVVNDGEVTTVTWYEGDPGSTGIPQVTPSAVDLNNVVELWVQTDDGTCTNAIEVTLTILAEPVLIDPMIEVCSSDTGLYDLTQHDDVVRDNDAALMVKWYEGDPGGAGVEISPATGVDLNSIVSLWVQTDNGTCTNNMMLSVTINVSPSITDPNITVCSIEGMTYDLTSEDGVVNGGTGTTVNWYDGEPSNGGIEIDPATSVDLNSVAELWVETDDGTCKSKIEVSVILNPSPVINDPDLIVCSLASTGYDLTLHDSEVNGGDGTLTVNWYDGEPDNGGAIIAIATSVDLNGLDLWVETDDGICKSKIVVSVTIALEPVINDPTIVVCSHDTDPYDLTQHDGVVNGGDGILTVRWYDGEPGNGGTILSPANAVDLNGLDLWVETDDGTCRSKIEVTVTINPNPVVIDPNITVCTTEASLYDLTQHDNVVSGGDVTIDVDWYDGDPGNGGTLIFPATFVDLNGLDLWVETDSGTCASSIEVTLTINTSPTVVDPVIEVCSLESNSYDLTQHDTEVNGGLGTTVKWYNGEPGNGGVEITPATFVDLNGLDLWVETDSGACMSIIQVSVTITIEPVINDPTIAVCSHDTDPYDLTQHDGEVNGGDGTLTVIWYIGEPDNGGTILVPATAVDLNGLDLWVETDEGTCTSKIEVTVTISPNPIVIDPDIILCTIESNSYDLTQHDGIVNGGNGTLAVNWYDGEPSNGGVEINPATSVDLNVVTVLWVETNDGTCTSEIEVSITMNSNPVVLDPNIIVCSNEANPYDLTQHDGEVNGGDGTLTVNWYDGEPGNGGLLLNPATSVDLNGLDLWVETDDGTCTSKIEVTVTINTIPNVIDPDIEVCSNNTTPYDLTQHDGIVNGGDGTLIVTWYNGEPGNGGTILDPATSVDLSGLDLWVHTSDGICTNYVMVTTTINTEPMAFCLVVNNESCTGEADGSASVSATGGSGIYSYLWPSGGTSVVEDNLASGSYVVTLTDGNDCEATCTVVIEPGVDISIIENIQSLCNDNGTPSDPSDDWFSITVNSSVINGGINNMYELVQNADGDGTNGIILSTSIYGTAIDYGTIAPHLFVADGVTTYNLTIRDKDSPTCHIDFTTTVVESCSDLCDIMASYSNVICHDNGTESDPSDDTYTFDLLVTGENTGTMWTDDIGNTGTYDVSETIGPFNISSGMMTIIITDDVDGSCETEIMITPPASCSGTCSIASSIVSINCDDNGTASDPSDDIFYVEVLITGSNTGISWIDNISNSGSYDVVETLGPFNIVDGDFTIEFMDVDDSGCTTSLYIAEQQTCSFECELFVVVGDEYCDDNGTPSDPFDDKYYIDITVYGNNTGSSWLANDPNSSSGNYEVTTTLGPYAVGSDITFDITDILDSDCISTMTIEDPGSCSTDCIIEATLVSTECDPNGTPFDETDDVFTFVVSVTGNNIGLEWEADDANTTTDFYANSPTTFGPYLITGGTLVFNITDQDDTECTTELIVVPPVSCSNDCFVSATIIGDPECDNSGTPSDPEDDTYTVEIVVDGINSSSTWTADDDNTTTGVYGSSVTTFGPYLISDGALSFYITDDADVECKTLVEVEVPETCSNECELIATVGTPLCDNNGTPSDPDDDTFTVEVEMSGNNLGSSWTANDPLNTIDDYANSPTVFGPYLILNGDFNFIITDDTDNGCTTIVEVEVPVTCSNDCELIATVGAPLCDNNGTPSDPEDDTYTVEIEVSGNNIDTSWTATDPLGTTDNYENSPTVFGPYPISGGNISFSIIDDADVNCTVDVDIIVPSTCSEECEITASYSNKICNSNGTESDPDDDTYTFDLLVEGNNTGIMWTDALGNMGSYDTLITLGPFEIGDGPFTLVITDNDDNGCQYEIDITPPDPCSGTCSIASTVVSTTCDGNGTITEPMDDVFYVEVKVTGGNTGSGWTDDLSNSGEYEEIMTLGPFTITDGDFTLVITDDSISTCITELVIIAPAPCSDQCIITANVNVLTCNDNGTTWDTSDDDYMIDVTLTGFNVSSSWTGDDGSNGSYNILSNIGPYLILDGDFTIVFSDINDTECIVSVDIEAPEYCSDDCKIDAVVTNVLCDNNGTDQDSDDDTYTFDVDVSGFNTSSSGWIANNLETTTGDYINTVTFGPYLISDGGQNFDVMDMNDNNCTTSIEVVVPDDCSNPCYIVVNSIVTLDCDDNGTPGDPDDDIFSITINVSGDNTTQSYMIAVGSTEMGPYDYNVSHTINGFNANGEEIIIEVFDVDIHECLESFVISQEGCSDGCPSINLDDQSTICNNELYLDLSSLVNNSALGSWDFVSGPAVLDIDNNQINPTDKPGGQYLISYHINDIVDGCINSDTVSLEIFEVLPNSIIGGDTLCLDDELEIMSDGEFTSYNWNTGETTQSIFIIEGGTYQLSVFDNNSCEVISSITINEIEEIEANDDEFSISRKFNLPFDLLKNDILINYSDVEITILSAPSLGQLEINDDGLYKYIVNSNIGNFEDEFTYRICHRSCLDLCETAIVKVLYTVENKEELEMLLTPNGDGETETLSFDEISENLETDYPDNRIIVYNRWGDAVYKASPYNNDWDGNDLPDGTYYFVLQLNNEDVIGSNIYYGYVLIVK